jgi:hypothetical protein
MRRSRRNTPTARIAQASVFGVAGATLAAGRWRANEAALEARSTGALRSGPPDVAGCLEVARCVAIAGGNIVSLLEPRASIGTGGIAGYPL